MDDAESREANGPFSPRRRTAVILTGEGSSAAYLTGVLKALVAAGVRVDIVMGRGAGALVAAFAAIGAEERLYGENGLFESFESRRPFRLRSLPTLALSLMGVAIAAFVAPLALGLASVVVLPLALFLPLFSSGSAEGSSSGVAVLAAWIAAFVAAAEPLYLRAFALPVAALFLAFLVVWGRSVWRGGGLRDLAREAGIASPPYDLRPLRRRLVELLWECARGASPESRPRDAKELSEAYVELLSGGLGQTGFRELVFYALDTDAGRETRFALLKERFFKRWRGEIEHGAEPIDLAGAGKALVVDALLAAASPVGLVREVEIALPLGTRSGGEVHRFASSVLASGSGVADAVAAGAEQILYVTGSVPHEPARGNAWERAFEAAARARLDEDLRWIEIERRGEIPVFVIRPERTRRGAFEFPDRASRRGRFRPSARARAEAQGSTGIELRALVAHGERDAGRLFVRPALSSDPAEPDERTVPIARDGLTAGPREL